ncbi:MAG: HAD family hydrolase [Epulopiscium sp.]|nr:HAD family hydrolase [Candidatus Epulonipiscium sp.]
MNYKIIFSDMDYTLLNHNLQISQKNKNAIQKLSAKNIPFVLCTGRGIYGVEPFVKELSLTKGYVITQNGAAIYELPHLNLIEMYSFPAEEIRIALQEAQKLGIDIQLYYDRILMTERLSPRVIAYSQRMEVDITLIPDALEYNGNLTKCLFNGPAQKLSQLKEIVTPHLEGKVNMFFSNKEYWEITGLEASKGKAALRLAQKLGIPSSSIVAMGDSENDISMLQAAGLGIAVSNAPESVKKSAHKVLEISCDEDAVAHVIEEYF